MMACHATTAATCTTTFSSTRLFNFLFILFIYFFVWFLFLVLLMQHVGVSSDHVPLFLLLCKIIKKKGIFFWIDPLPPPRWPTIWIRASFSSSFYFFFSFFGWVKRTKRKKERNKKRENGQMTTAIVGTTIWRNNSIAGWTAIYEFSFLVAPSSSFIQAAQFSVLYVCAVVALALLYGWFPMH